MSIRKPTFRASFENGEGSIGNLERFRENEPMMKVDLLSDWINDLKKEYDLALVHYSKVYRLRK